MNDHAWRAQGDHEAKPEKCAQLASLLIAHQLVPKLVLGIEKLPFEARKHLAQVYNNLVRRDLSGFVAYVERHSEVLSALVRGYENAEIALNCGTMLREVLCNFPVDSLGRKKGNKPNALLYAVDSPRSAGAESVVLG